MNKERIAQCKDALRRSKEFIALDIVEQLEKENKIMEDILIGEQMENEQLKARIDRMKCCRNCKYWNVPDDVFNTPCEECDVCKDFNKWELAE